MTFNRAILCIGLLAAVFASLFVIEEHGHYAYPGTQELAQEYPPPGEAQAVQEIVAGLKEVLKVVHPEPERTGRGAHAKQHGLLKAIFTVPQLDPAYQVGVFSEPKTYKAWVRYSSLSGKDPDAKKGARGLAIKLMGVEGEKLLADERDATTQDFIFMSTPFFVSKDVRGFADLLGGLRGGKMATLKYFITHPGMFILVQKSNSLTPDLAGVDWSSATPYLFGDRAVKYAIRPASSFLEDMPEGEPSEDFLRERLAERLRTNGIDLDFYIQFQTDPDTMQIEDPRIPWSEDVSPLIKVARIRIPLQEFDTPEQQLYGDQLSFTIWHSLPEHRPLGGINRGRKEIYKTLSEFRHERNGETTSEPDDWQSFAAE